MVSTHEHLYIYTSSHIICVHIHVNMMCFLVAQRCRAEAHISLILHVSFNQRFVQTLDLMHYDQGSSKRKLHIHLLVSKFVKSLPAYIGLYVYITPAHQAAKNQPTDKHTNIRWLINLNETNTWLTTRCSITDEWYYTKHRTAIARRCTGNSSRWISNLLLFSEITNLQETKISNLARQVKKPQPHRLYDHLWVWFHDNQQQHSEVVDHTECTSVAIDRCPKWQDTQLPITDHLWNCRSVIIWKTCWVVIQSLTNKKRQEHALQFL